MTRALTLEDQLRRSVHHAHAKRIGRMDDQAIVKMEQQGRMAAAVVVHGDLSAMSEGQLATYYVELCRSLDLNPLTRPFTLLRLNGKLIYYANKDCSDQLRKRDRVSVAIVNREEIAELLIITARATLPDGRTDESIGALPLGKLTGEARANALMKCETKAKRRVTLSICGLGFLDESELDGAQAADNGSSGPISSHAAPDENPHAPAKPSDTFTTLMDTLRVLDTEAFDPGCTWETMTSARSVLGRKGEPTAFSKQLSALYQSDDIAPSQKKELAALWNRVDRKLGVLESKLKPPSVEASFMDPPDDGDVCDGTVPPDQEPPEPTNGERRSAGSGQPKGDDNGR